MRIYTNEVVISNPSIKRNQIIFHLKKVGYHIKKNTDNVIIFNNDSDSWKTESRSESYKRIDNGKFEFIESEKGSILKFCVNVYFTFELSAILGSLVGGVFLSQVVFLITVFLVFIVAEKIHAVVKISKKILSNVLQNDEISSASVPLS
ncbi:MAG: hypothetical protein H7Y07_11155 [Pyrinomonadaceae bacterium]|nr:hypothetical protein [Sphingobacteriaceae bacterium]